MCKRSDYHTKIIDFTYLLFLMCYSSLLNKAKLYMRTIHLTTINDIFAISK